MTTQRIILGDCLDVFANERNVPAFVSDPPANIEFMGRSWDGAEPAVDYVPMIPARDKAHLRELQIEYSFQRYWAERYAMAYDIADQHAVNIVWTLPRTSHQTANALRAAGWTIKDNIVHLFGTGWAKSGNALAPGQEGWLLASKGKPDLGIDACRVPRGSEEIRTHTGGPGQLFAPDDAKYKEPTRHTNGSLPKNALLSHCEGCVPAGSKRVKGSVNKGCVSVANNANGSTYGTRTDHAGHDFASADGTESVPAFHCLAGCVCGASTPWPDDRPLPKCPCGETWRWLCPVAEVNGQTGDLQGRGNLRPSFGGGGSFGLPRQENPFVTFGDQGGASRFFNTFSYLSKCSPSERHAGCENLFWKAAKKDPFGFVQVTREEWDAIEVTNEHLDCIQKQARRERTGKAQGNVHPTVKSYRLMHWLHGLTGAKRILDFTAGSGTGMYTAHLDDIDWLGAEICPQAIVIAEARLAFWKGLSFEARDGFMRDDVVPMPVERDPRNMLLFA